MTTKLDKAVDDAIARENNAFERSPEQQAEACALGDRYRIWLEKEGILPPLNNKKDW